MTCEIGGSLNVSRRVIASDIPGAVAFAGMDPCPQIRVVWVVFIDHVNVTPARAAEIELAGLAAARCLAHRICSLPFDDSTSANRRRPT